ncbi:fructosamine kinase family protein [Aliikangiella sp. G2MR2-5]|uniref:fructosamine kinase family protein n=1 Tax=Aliikangiella sp. G2MR2-5 TaxID=2788943 RepID=UPI0018AC346E|nr:fructosamine kinase family protein [Aliikangiella sp. G2MR2-5]
MRLNGIEENITSSILESINANSIENWILTGLQPVSGGDINEAFALTLSRPSNSNAENSSQRKIFVKLNSRKNSVFFKSESIALELINLSRQIKCPRVISRGEVGDFAYLVLEFIPLNKKGDIKRFAQELAMLHANNLSKNGYYGFYENNFIGATPQVNTWKANWVEFFAQCRLSTQLKLLKKKGLSSRDYQKAIGLIDELPVFFENYQPKASFVHGDLWSGNYAFNEQGDPIIFDPASYYGDHEVDLAMLELFGEPGEEFYSAYEKCFPINQGYRYRKSLYNLYHILNHANLFGGSYYSQAMSMVDQLISFARKF